MISDEVKLYNLCYWFIQDNKISCPESISQCDWVIENAYELIQNICDIVGYHKYEE
jgi:hypothetical protein